MTNFRDLINPDAATVHISGGNVKTGAVPSYSTLPGDGLHIFSDGRAAVNVTGTCAGVCDACKGHCYAMRSLRYRTAARAWAENTFIQRDNPAAVFHAVTRFCNRGNVPYFRVHVSGEFERISPATGYADTFALWASIAEACPNTIFYAYTKRGDLIDEYSAAMPSNFIVQFSEWAPDEKNAEKYAPATNCAVFAYDDGTRDELRNVKHCPAVSRDGRQTGITCAQCRHCMKCKPGDVIAVYAH